MFGKGGARLIRSEFSFLKQQKLDQFYRFRYMHRRPRNSQAETSQTAPPGKSAARHTRFSHPLLDRQIQRMAQEIIRSPGTKEHRSAGIEKCVDGVPLLIGDHARWRDPPN